MLILFLVHWCCSRPKKKFKNTLAIVYGSWCNHVTYIHTYIHHTCNGTQKFDIGDSICVLHCICFSDLKLKTQLVQSLVTELWPQLQFVSKRMSPNTHAAGVFFYTHTFISFNTIFMYAAQPLPNLDITKKIHNQNSKQRQWRIWHTCTWNTFLHLYTHMQYTATYVPICI